MSRDEMLTILKKLEFRYVWDGGWEDIGFTERPIWINRNGYGYILCDEPCSNWKLDSFSDSKWREIKEKLKSGKLVSDDFAGTSFESEDWIWESIEDTDDICELLKGLINLPDTLDEFFYCVSTYDGYAFYATYDKFKEAVERDDCDYAWDDLSDDILELWIERLNNGELDGDLFP